MLRQIRYGDHFEAVLHAEVHEIGHSRHAAIGVHECCIIVGFAPVQLPVQAQFVSGVETQDRIQR